MYARTVGIIGTGSLGTHLAKMLLTQRELKTLMEYPCKHYVPPISVIGSVRSPDREGYLDYHFGHSLRLFRNNSDIAKKSDIIILSVKPGQVKAVCEEIKTALREDKIVISTAAAVSLDKLHEWLPRHPNIIRCMPNVPCSIGSGVATYYSKYKHAQLVMDDLFKPNEVIPLYSDKEMDVSTIVSGCGPALISYYIDSIMKAVEGSLHPQTLNNLISHTMIGTADMLKNQSVKEIIKQVASPNGATERALLMMNKHEVDKEVRLAVATAYNHIQRINENL